MEESTKKIFKPKFELVQECNGLSIHLGKHAAAAILKGQKSLEPPRKIIKCWWCVVQFLEIALNALGVRPEELCQDSKGIFI
jgi:hypothetical protein